MAKTYKPSAIKKAADLSKYFGKYDAKLTIGTTAAQLEAYLALKQAASEFLALWPAAPIEP